MTRTRMLPWMVRRLTGTATVLLALSFIVCGAGCSDAPRTKTSGGRAAGWTPTRLPNVSKAQAFDAGVYAMRQWFRLAETSPSDGVIRGTAEEFDQQGGTGRIRDGAVGYRNRMRRIAALTIREQDGGSVARCRVQVERLDTADHRVFRRQQQFGDVPNETPIDREASVSAEQNQVWTPMPRDRNLERQILALLRDRALGEETR